jgi:uncharacterized membrane protein
MAATTFLCRGGGYWLFRQITPTPFLRRVLFYLPGTLFIAYVAPALAEGGAQQWAGAVATLAVMVVLRSLPAAVVAGTAAAWIVWQFG